MLLVTPGLYVMHVTIRSRRGVEYHLAVTGILFTLSCTTFTFYYLFIFFIIILLFAAHGVIYCTFYFF